MNPVLYKYLYTYNMSDSNIPQIIISIFVPITLGISQCGQFGTSANSYDAHLLEACCSAGQKIFYKLDVTLL